MTPWITYAIITAILVAVELAYFYFAKRYGIIDKPNSRSSHTRVILRGGGIIFMIAPWVWALFFGIKYPQMLVGLTLIGAVSFIDDVHSIPNRWRLLTQFTAVALAITALPIPIYWWIWIPALIVAVGIINAFNFMDGINGITGCYALSVLAPLWAINSADKFVSMPLIYVVAISVAVFLWFNYRGRARCFAGDVGSVSIAFILLFMLGCLMVTTGSLVWLLFIAVYGADSILTIVHRIMLHENLGKAHRKHAYQLMSNELHLPHRLVSAIYMAIQLAISFGLIYCCPHWRWIYFAAIVIGLALAYVLFMRRYYHLHEDYLKSLK